MCIMNVILISRGIQVEAKHQAQYFVDISKWAFCIRNVSLKVEVFCPKSSTWMKAIENILSYVDPFLEDNHHQFVMDPTYMKIHMIQWIKKIY